MPEHVLSATVNGLDASCIELEIEIAPQGLPALIIVGLADAAVRESRDRIRTALRLYGAPVPQARVTVNLAPASRRKAGAAFDLPMAVGIAEATRRLVDGGMEPPAPMPRLHDHALIGELSLSGGVRPVAGILAMVEALRARPGVRGVLVPEQNAAEAALVEGIDVIAVRDLTEALGFLAARIDIAPTRADPDRWLHRSGGAAAAELALDYAEVVGHEREKMLMAAAVAGGHHALLVGPPGSGKTMLCRRAESIAPPLSLEEALEVTRVHSIAGLLPPRTPIVPARPFRAPHHGISAAALVGGGPTPRAGEIALATTGVLFLDEVAEFQRDVLEALRQPLEEGRISVARARGTVVFPARITLLAAMNPCPCGWVGGGRRCSCPPATIQRYLGRLSGPLLDRFDILAFPRPPDAAALASARAEGAPTGACSAALRRRVERAWRRQRERFAAERSPTRCNARMSPRETVRLCRLDRDGRGMIENALRTGLCTARGRARVMRLALTLADLDGADRIEAGHVQKALAVRPRPIAQALAEQAVGACQ